MTPFTLNYVTKNIWQNLSNRLGYRVITSILCILSYEVIHLNIHTVKQEVLIGSLWQACEEMLTSCSERFNDFRLLSQLVKCTDVMDEMRWRNSDPKKNGIGHLSQILSNLLTPLKICPSRRISACFSLSRNNLINNVLSIKHNY